MLLFFLDLNSLDLSHPIHDLLFYMEMSSDRSWMYGPHLCNEYTKGLDAFIDFVKKDMLDNVRGNLCRPCKHYMNEKRYHTYDVSRPHLVKHGLMEDYRC
jgi:hypothetical protein